MEHDKDLEHRKEPAPLPGSLTPAEVAGLSQQMPQVRLLDVRTAAEFTSEHIRGAYNVPLETLGEHAREIRASRQSPLVLVCRSGQRARTAEVALKAAGLEHLHVLDGGVTAWVAAGLPLVRGRQTMSLERQVRIAAGSLAATGGLLAALCIRSLAGCPHSSAAVWSSPESRIRAEWPCSWPDCLTTGQRRVTSRLPCVHCPRDVLTQPRHRRRRRRGPVAAE